MPKARVLNRVRVGFTETYGGVVRREMVVPNVSCVNRQGGSIWFTELDVPTVFVQPDEVAFVQQWNTRNHIIVGSRDWVARSYGFISEGSDTTCQQAEDKQSTSEA